MRVALVYLNNDKLVSRGVGYIAQAVRRAGHHLDFYDTVWTTDEGATQSVIQGGYDVLMLSSTSLYADRALRIAEAVREATTTTIIMGGIHATIVRGKILDESPAVDYICVGEGEEFIVEFLAKLGTPELLDVQNLGYRNKDSLAVVNPVRPCTDIRSLGMFRPETFNPGSVAREEHLVPGLTYVFATRGCPYRCTYCCNSYGLDLYGKSFLRTQDPSIVIAELLHLKANYPSTLFYFGDEMVLFDEDYCAGLFQRIHDEVQMPYGCMCRVERITPRIVEVFRQTGCKYVGMGIECGDEQFRREWLHRYMTNDQIVNTFRSLRENVPGIYLVSYNMRGYPVPYDDRLTAATRALNDLVKPDHVQITWYSPLRGTPLGDYCWANGLVDEELLATTNDYFARSVLRPISPTLAPSPPPWKP